MKDSLAVGLGFSEIQLLEREFLGQIFFFLCRSVHYPPETASIMLMARMVATVKQVSPPDPPREAYSGLIQPLASFFASPQDPGLDADFLLSSPNESCLLCKP